MGLFTAGRYVFDVTYVRQRFERSAFIVIAGNKHAVHPARAVYYGSSCCLNSVNVCSRNGKVLLDNLQFLSQTTLNGAGTQKRRRIADVECRTLLILKEYHVPVVLRLKGKRNQKKYQRQNALT
jgi:hypothetical protein